MTTWIALTQASKKEKSNKRKELGWEENHKNSWLFTLEIEYNFQTVNYIMALGNNKCIL